MTTRRKALMGLMAGGAAVSATAQSDNNTAWFSVPLLYGWEASVSRGGLDVLKDGNTIHLNVTAWRPWGEAPVEIARLPAWAAPKKPVTLSMFDGFGNPLRVDITTFGDVVPHRPVNSIVGSGTYTVVG